MNTALMPPPKSNQKPMRPPTKPVEYALFHDGRWYVWQFDGVPMLFEKFRRVDGKTRSTLGYDFEPMGKLDVKPENMDPMVWGDMLGAVAFWKNGITA